VAIVLIAALTACSSNSNSTSGNSGNSGGSNASGSSEASGGGKIKISWWDTMTSDASVAALNKIIEDYESEHPDVDIERTFISNSDIKKKLLLGSVGDDGPDIVWIDNPDHQAYAAAGILADLTEEIEEWGQGDRYFEGPWSSTIYEGRNYGVPIGSNNLALYYNTEMLAEAGIEPPTTWDELKEAAKALTKGDVYGFAVSAVKSEEGTFQFLPFLYQAGSDITNFDSEGTLDALNLYKYMIDNKYMSGEVITLKQADVATQFAAGKVAMMVNGTWQIPFLLTNATVNWDVVQLPVYKQAGTVLGGENWAITKNSKHKDIAWDIIKFANEPERLKSTLMTNGRMPARSDLIGDPFWQEDPQMKVFADSMAFAKARAYGPNYPTISEAVQTMLQEVITGAKKPEDAMKAAAAVIQEELK
jgi:multiple sugar transport system substrate-binding protein